MDDLEVPLIVDNGEGRGGDFISGNEGHTEKNVRRPFHS